VRTPRRLRGPSEVVPGRRSTVSPFRAKQRGAEQIKEDECPTPVKLALVTVRGGEANECSWAALVRTALAALRSCLRALAHGHRTASRKRLQAQKCGSSRLSAGREVGRGGAERGGRGARGELLEVVRLSGVVP